MPCNALLIQFLESTDDDSNLSCCQKKAGCGSQASIDSIIAVEEGGEDVSPVDFTIVKKDAASKEAKVPAVIVFNKRICNLQSSNGRQSDQKLVTKMRRSEVEVQRLSNNDQKLDGRHFRFIVTKSLWSQEERTVLTGLRDLVQMCSRVPSDNDDEVNENENYLHELVLLGGHLGVVCAMQAFRRSVQVQMQGLHLLLMLGSSLNHRWLNVLGQLGGMSVAVQALLSFPTSRSVSSSSSSPRSRVPAALHSRSFQLITILISTRENMERFVSHANDLGLSQLVSTIDQEHYDMKTQRLIRRLLHKLSAWKDEEGDDLLADMHESISSFEGVWMTSADASIKSNVTESTFEESETSNGDGAESLPSSQKAGDHFREPEDGGDIFQGTSKRVTFAPFAFEEGDGEGDDISEVSIDNSSIVDLSSEIVEIPPESGDSGVRGFVQAAINELLSFEDPSEPLRVIRQSFKTAREEYARIFLEVGGPLALMQCLVDRVALKNVQLRGYDVLHQLMKLDGFGDILGELGAVQIVIQGMKTHPGSETLVRDACHALVELLTGSSANVDRFIEADGIPVVVKAIDTFANQTTMLYRACQVLQQCVSSYKMFLLQHGVASALSRVIEGNLNHEKTNATARAVVSDLLLS